MKKWIPILTIATLLSTFATAGKGWETDFDKASAKAKAEKKYILLNFSGSDWCGWCIKLDKEVFSTKAFKEYAKENLVLVLADFPKDTSKQNPIIQKSNQLLKKKYNVKRFPTVFILNPNGETILKTGYRHGGSEAYVQFLKENIPQAKKEK